MRNRTWLLTFLLLTVAATLQAAGRPTERITGIYSNLQYIEEAGDLLGMELLIVPSEPGYSVVVQISEGGAPYTAVVPLLVDGHKVEFTLPASGPYKSEHFTGTWKGREIVIRWSQGQIERLRRGKSYWQ